MSETVHYKGLLKKVTRDTGETLEEQCKRLLGNKELPSYFDSYQEYLLDEHYQNFYIQDNDLYLVEKEEIDPDSNIFNANIKDNGDIEFEVKYYNGSCSFDEAIDIAFKTLKMEETNESQKKSCLE